MIPSISDKTNVQDRKPKTITIVTYRENGVLFELNKEILLRIYNKNNKELPEIISEYELLIEE